MMKFLPEKLATIGTCLASFIEFLRSEGLDPAASLILLQMKMDLVMVFDEEAGGASRYMADQFKAAIDLDLPILLDRLVDDSLQPAPNSSAAPSVAVSKEVWLRDYVTTGVIGCIRSWTLDASNSPGGLDVQLSCRDFEKVAGIIDASFDAECRALRDDILGLATHVAASLPDTKTSPAAMLDASARLKRPQTASILAAMDKSEAGRVLIDAASLLTKRGAADTISDKKIVQAERYLDDPSMLAATTRDGDVVVSNTHLVSTMDITHANRESAEQVNEALTLWSSVRREEAVHGDISAYFVKVAWLLRLIDLVLCGRFAIAFGDRGLASDGSIGLRAHHGLCARPSRDQLFSFNGPWFRVVTRKLSSCNVRRVCASRVDFLSM